MRTISTRRCPPEREDGILRGMYLLSEAPKRTKKPVVQLLGSGTILREVMAGADLLAERLACSPTCGA